MQVRALHAEVRGRVQGVGFRWFVVREAAALGLRGYARNRPDGSVEVVAAGDAASLDRLVARLRVGPPAAAVEVVECRALEPVPDFDRFEIRH
jgi:acylphosphatase